MLYDLSHFENAGKFVLAFEFHKFVLFACPNFRCHNICIEWLIMDVSTISRFQQDYDKARTTVIARQEQRKEMSVLKAEVIVKWLILLNFNINSILSWIDLVFV